MKMAVRKAIGLLLVVICVFVSCMAQAQENKKSSEPPIDAQIDHFIVDYYKERPVFQTGPMIKRMRDLGFLDTAPASQMGFVGFFAAHFANHPDRVLEWLNHAELNQSQAATFIRAMQHAQMENKIGLYVIKNGWSYDPRVTLSNLPPVLDMTVTRPGGVDMVWGAFFATGREDYIHKLTDMLDSLPNRDAGEDASMMDKLIRDSIEWTFKRSVKRHDMVYWILERDMAEREHDSDTKDIVAAVLKTVPMPFDPSMPATEETQEQQP